LNTSRVFRLRGLSLYPLLTVKFDNLNSERRYSPAHVYHHAKLALVMFTYELSSRLKETDVITNCVWVPNEKLGEDRQTRISPLKVSILHYSKPLSPWQRICISAGK
jgi:hypothetical protein